LNSATASLLFPPTFGLPTNLDLCRLQISDLKYEPDGHSRLPYPAVLLLSIDNPFINIVENDQFKV